MYQKYTIYKYENKKYTCINLYEIFQLKIDTSPKKFLLTALLRILIWPKESSIL